MSHKIPALVYRFITENPHITGAELSREFNLAPRTARRWAKWWREGTLAPKNDTIPTKEEKEEDELWGELFDIADRLNEIKNRRNPVLTHVEISFEGNGPVGIIFASCSHLGSRWTDHKAFRDLIAKVLEVDGLYFAPLGDEIEGYIASFRDASAVQNQALPVPMQSLAYEQLLEVLVQKNKLLWGVGSQHGSQWQERRSGLTPMRDLYVEQGLPWFDGQAYVKLNVGNQIYNIAISHQFPGHSMYNRLHAQTRAHKFNFPNADAIIQGDKHTYALTQDTSYVWEYDAGNRASPYVWYAQVGTAKTGPEPYTIQNWHRGVFEWPILVFYDNTHDIEGTPKLDIAQYLLRDTSHGKVVWKNMRESFYKESEPVVTPAMMDKAIAGAKYSGSE